MKRRAVRILCVQETKWNRNKAKELGQGYKLFYGLDTRRNGVGIILDSELKKGVMNVEWISDRIIKIKCEVEDEIINVLSVYAPQVGCKEEEKKMFWEELEDTIRDIPVGERTSGLGVI